MIKALYVHVPFCAHICSYCDFMRVGYHPSLVQQYLNGLKQEILTYDLKEIDTLYLGGGTPSALSAEELRELFEILTPYIDQCLERTIEINPETLTQDKLKVMVEYGINRVSLGVQSFDEEELLLLNRLHKNEHVLTCIEMLRTAGITNISIDLMYALPHQTYVSFEKNLDIALALPITHLSIYALTIEENSTWGRQDIQAVDPEIEEKMYEIAQRKCVDAGFESYEISNFTKGFPSAHNLHYWHYDEYAGLGPGATSMVNHVRIENTHNLLNYAQGQCVETRTDLDYDDRCFERIMMGLRIKAGIDLKDYLNQTKLDLLKLYPEAIQSNVEKGLLKVTDTHLVCTAQGFALLHDVLVDFME